MKHRMPFLLWIILQSHLGMYAYNCTQSADSLYRQAGQYVTSIRNSQDPAEQILLEKKALADYKAAFETLASSSCSEELYTLEHADFAYKLATRALNLKYQENAIQLYQIALRIRKDSLSPGDHNIVKCYANLSMANRQLLRLEESRRLLDLGFIEVNQKVGDLSKNASFFKAYLYHEAAQLHIDKGDPYGALGFNTVAWNLYGEIEKYSWQVKSGNQRGVIFEKLKEHEEGIAHLKEVEKLSLEKAKSTWIQKIYMNLGNMYYLGKNLPEALNYYEKTIAAAANDKLIQAGAYSNLALIYFEKDQYEAAIDNYQKAEEIYRTIANSAKGRIFLGNSLTGIGDVYREENKFEEAFKYYQQALSLMVKAHDSTDITRLPAFDKLEGAAANRFLIETLGAKAKTFFQQYQRDHTPEALQAANDHYFLAIKLIDELRINFQEQESKLFLMNEVYPTYEGAIEVAFYQGNKAYAFQLSEKAKATLLYASMMDKEAKSFADIPQEALDTEIQLKRDVAILEQQRDQLSEGDEQYKEVLEELLEKKRELTALIEEFGRKYPDYYRIKYDTELVDVAEIQSQLGDSTLMIEYFAGNEKWFAFALSKDHIEMREMYPLKIEIQEYAALLPHTESWINEIPAGQKELFDCLGNQLYKELMGGLWDKDQWKYSIIIPDREIYYLPIDALLTQKPKEQLPVSLYPFLLKDMATSYDFSAKLWLKGVTRKSSTGWFQKGFLAFAPDFTPIGKQDLNAEEKKLMSQDFFKGRSEPDSSTDLIPLLASKDEIERVQELLGGEIFPAEGKKGLLGRFIKEAPSYRFIHLGTHGIFNKYNSKYSYLAFQPVEDNIDNERLYLSDLYNLNLDAELVVLSACETQAGELLPGEGIASLAQGFTYAGAKSIVATLWSVQNASNAELMKRFYQNLIEGDNKALALQKAKISMNREGSSYGPPFYWAAPAVIGSTAPINPPSPILRYLLLSISLLMACSIGFVLFNRNRKLNG
ncbi:MAG: CHAT domain-containing tetratricopeptide repeat protein [Bacteroidota bacterium]